MQTTQDYQPVWIVYEDDRPLMMCTNSNTVQQHVDAKPQQRRGVLYAPAGTEPRFGAPMVLQND